MNSGSSSAEAPRAAQVKEASSWPRRAAGAPPPLPADVQQHYSSLAPGGGAGRRPGRHGRGTVREAAEIAGLAVLAAMLVIGFGWAVCKALFARRRSGSAAFLSRAGGRCGGDFQLIGEEGAAAAAGGGRIGGGEGSVMGGGGYQQKQQRFVRLEEQL